MRKSMLITVLAIAIFIIGVCCVGGCVGGCNYKVVDLTYKYNYAYIELQNGEIIEGEVENWTDYEGEQLQVQIDGVIYLTNSFNCTLIYNPNL